MPGLRAEAGSRPGGRGTFLCFAKEKYPKERRPPVCDPFAVRRGKPAECRLRGAPQNSLRAGALRSDNCGESVHEAWALRRPCHPATAPPQAQPAGVGQPNSQHPFGPLLRSAQFAQRVALAPARWGRAKQRPVWMFWPLCPSGCAEERRVWRIRARVCLSDAQRRELSETPSNPSTAGCPVASAQGTQTVGSPFLWFLSFGDAKERDSHAGRLPASALSPSTPYRPENERAQTLTLRQAQDRQFQPERLAVCPGFDRLSPNGWGVPRLRPAQSDY